MNTPTPAQALGEVMADIQAIMGARNFTITKFDNGDAEIAGPKDFMLAVTKCLDLVITHGQHFAGLEAELRDWQNLLTAVIAPRGLPGVSVEYPKLWPFDGGQDAAMVAFALHTAIERAEAAESRCAELEVECADLRKRHHETLIAWEAEITNSGYAEARVREAGVLAVAMVAEWRAVAQKHRQRAEQSAQSGDLESEGFSNGMAERSDYCADELARIAAFLAARC